MITKYVCNVDVNANPTTNAFDNEPLVPPVMNFGRKRKQQPVAETECLIPPSLNYAGDPCEVDDDCSGDGERCNDDGECECADGTCNGEAPLVPPTMPNFGQKSQVTPKGQGFDVRDEKRRWQ